MKSLNSLQVPLNCFNVVNKQEVGFRVGVCSLKEEDDDPPDPQTTKTKRASSQGPTPLSSTMFL